jgi:hypothetical protein
MRNKISDPYKATSKITDLIILIFIFLHRANARDLFWNFVTNKFLTVRGC